MSWATAPRLTTLTRLTALYTAVEAGKVDVARLFIGRGAHIGQPVDPGHCYLACIDQFSHDY